MPGKVVYPAFPADAKGLLLAAIDEPNPVMFFEHKALYRSLREDVPDGYYTLEIGKAARVREGEDISIITYGAAVHRAMEILDKHIGNAEFDSASSSTGRMSPLELLSEVNDQLDNLL